MENDMEIRSGDLKMEKKFGPISPAAREVWLANQWILYQDRQQTDLYHANAHKIYLLAHMIFLNKCIYIYRHNIYIYKYIMYIYIYIMYIFYVYPHVYVFINFNQ